MSRFAAGVAGLIMSVGLLGCPPAESPPPPPPEPAPQPPEPEPLAPVDWSQLPTPAEASTWSLPEVNTWTMGNGMRVWHLEQSSAPLVSMRIVFPRGSATDPPGKEGLTALTGDMLDEGAAGKSALELDEAFQRLATDYGTSSDVDAVTVRLDMLADKLDPSLGLLADVLRRPSLPAEEFKRRKDLWVASALSRESDPSAAAAVVLRRVLYGRGYLGGRAAGTKTSLKAISHADIKAHYPAVFQPQGATIVVVGAVDAAALRGGLKKAFGDWKGSPTAKPAAVAPSELPAKAVYLVDFPKASQSTVIAARRAPGIGADDHFPALVFNRSLGGAFTSRLNLNLREDKGYTYGARSYFARYRNAGYHLLSAQVKGETTRPSVDEFLRELTDVATGRPISETEHQEAIDGLIKGFPGRFERLSSTAGQLASEAESGRPAGWLGAWPGRVKTASLDATRKAATRYAKPDDYVLVIAGATAGFKEALSELDRPFYTCDAEGHCRR